MQLDAAAGGDERHHAAIAGEGGVAGDGERGGGGVADRGGLDRVRRAHAEVGDLAARQVGEGGRASDFDGACADAPPGKGVQAGAKRVGAEHADAEGPVPGGKGVRRPLDEAGEVVEECGLQRVLVRRAAGMGGRCQHQRQQHPGDRSNPGPRHGGLHATDQVMLRGTAVFTRRLSRYSTARGSFALPMASAVSQPGAGRQASRRSRVASSARSATRTVRRPTLSS